MIIIMNEKSWMKIRNKEKKQKSEKKSEMKLKKLTPLVQILLERYAHSEIGGTSILI